MVSDDHLIVLHNNVVAEEARRLVLENAAHQEAAAAPDGPSICFQIRRHNRLWVNEENGLCEIITACAHEWPQMVFYIDGHSSSKGALPAPAAVTEAEQAFANRLLMRLGALIDVRSIIGMKS